MDRTDVVQRMYQAYLDAHEQLVAGTSPGDLPGCAEFSARMDEDTTFFFQPLELELRGRDAIERFMVQARQAAGVRETCERVLEHGDLVISLNRSTMGGSDGETEVPVVAVFQFEGERLARFWGFAG